MPMSNLNPSVHDPVGRAGNHPQNIPALDDECLDDLTAVLKALAKGNYPRLDSVPLALNAYNWNRKVDIDPWAYFHPVTVITPKGKKIQERINIRLDQEIIDDLEKPWDPIRFTGGQFNREQQRFERGDWTPPPNSARYRFVCFIHKHRIDRKNIAQKGVHTISIWDREWDELTWHDTYYVDREVRFQEIQRFWRCIKIPHLVADRVANEDADENAGERRNEDIPGELFKRIRYRIVYDICERVEETLRNSVPPRNTLYAVIGAALHHMNNACDPQVSIVPDKLELFGAQAMSLLPRFFAHLLWLCLDARPGWSRNEREAFVKKFRILQRLRWMRVFVRRDLERRIAEMEDEGERDWVFGVLGI
ncbi:hypothetical protein F4806DRAFT_506953 [Annulohypoxylon nitens]|nr:hypothetical protein F4806DRAFT_506953 [Annulohypoxylon nitens]